MPVPSPILASLSLALQRLDAAAARAPEPRLPSRRRRCRRSSSRWWRNSTSSRHGSSGLAPQLALVAGHRRRVAAHTRLGPADSRTTASRAGPRLRQRAGAAQHRISGSVLQYALRGRHGGAVDSRSASSRSGGRAYNSHARARGFGSGRRRRLGAIARSRGRHRARARHRPRRARDDLRRHVRQRRLQEYGRGRDLAGDERRSDQRVRGRCKCRAPRHRSGQARDSLRRCNLRRWRLQEHRRRY